MAQVEVNSQVSYPWSSIVYIEAAFPNGQVYVGSGVMVGPNDVLTATHVVYSAADGGAAIGVSVAPGYDPDLGAPFGMIEAASWNYIPQADADGDRRMASGNGAIGLAEAELDVALIDLAVPVGYETGWMEIDPNFVEGVVNVTGYPALYGHDLMNEVGYVADSAVDWSVNIEELEVHPGNSGGPLWYAGADTAHVVGVVSTVEAAADIGGTYHLLVQAMAANDSLIALA